MLRTRSIILSALLFNAAISGCAERNPEVTRIYQTNSSVISENFPEISKNLPDSPKPLQKPKDYSELGLEIGKTTLEDISKTVEFTVVSPNQIRIDFGNDLEYSFQSAITPDRVDYEGLKNGLITSQVFLIFDSEGVLESSKVFMITPDHKIALYTHTETGVNTEILS